MHALHDYIAKQLADKIKSRRVVVWYDERGEFRPFVDEVRGGPWAVGEPVPVAVAGAKASLAEYAGSMFELRAVLEPYVSGDTPGLAVIYVPDTARDRRASVLMELETAGMTWEPQLKQLARHVLLQKYTLGVVDEMLPFDRKVSYEDLARACDTADVDPPSILKSIFHDASGSDGLLTVWIVSDARDPEIVSKEATQELTKLVKARLGLDLVGDAPLSKLRAITLRYVLAVEFRLDLTCDAPASLDSIGKPPTKDEESAVREIARRLRTSHADAYEALADRVEEELGLTNAKLPPGALGSIDTFRFEERALLRHAGDLVANGKFGEAFALVADREQSFWLDRDVSRKAQWEVTRRMAELGNVALEVRKAVNKTTGDAAAWLDTYVSKDGWFRLDQAQRRLETWVANLDEEPEERPLGVVRRAYEDACHAMSNGFIKALEGAGWHLGAALHQTQVYPQMVASLPKPVAYFLVDALRYEMGEELAARLPEMAEVSLRSAVAALPSITLVGMAALQPDASAHFTVVEKAGRLGAQIDDAFLPDLTSRRKFAAARIPNLVDLSLDELLGLPASRLAKKIGDAQIIFVRSQEIDQAGEAGFAYQARRVMDTVIDNLVRAIRKLANAGIRNSVVTADHGHLFFAADRDESMRADAPGGKTIELHRRCWIGRGGATPPGAVRVPATALGYASDLECVFPGGASVFRSGGDLAYCHGGPSLQEMVVPVVSVRWPDASATSQRASERVVVTNVPQAVTNRVFSVMIWPGDDQLLLGATGRVVQPLLLAGERQVGAVGMAVDAELDRSTGLVTLQPGKSATIAFVLSDETVPSVRVVVQDPATGTELFRSKIDVPVKLGVG